MKIALLFALLAAPLACAGATEPPSIAGEPHVYKRVGEADLRLWVARPGQWQPDDRRPAIVFFHGGGWIGGKVTQFEEHARHFVDRGAVCFLAHYRFVPRDDGTPPTVCIQDARSAMRWVRARAGEFGIDPQRIAAAGGSAGGHLAAHAALVDALDDPSDDLAVSPRPDALLLFNPVLDNGPGGFGASRVRERIAEFSPAHNVAPGAPPTVLFLGTEDKLIPVATLELFRDRMRAAGARCDLHIYEGQAHGFFNPSRSIEHFTRTLQTADEFLQSLGWLPPK